MMIELTVCMCLLPNDRLLHPCYLHHPTQDKHKSKGIRLRPSYGPVRLPPPYVAVRRSGLHAVLKTKHYDPLEASLFLSRCHSMTVEICPQLMRN